MVCRTILLTCFALATAQYIPNDRPSDGPSDRPSDSPTYIPTAIPTFGWQSDSPSNVPTILATNINHIEQASIYSGGQFAVPIPAFTTCDTCTRFGTLSDLNVAVSEIVDDGKICICPQTYSGGSCSSNGTRPSITIERGQNVTIECASADMSTCTFQCPNTLVQVNSGGIFYFVGNSRAEVIGSTIASRIIVESDANATISQVLFTSALSQRRKAMMDNNGCLCGGAIKSAGFLNVTQSSFYGCSSTKFGGAIYTVGSAAIIDSFFTKNSALVGGGVYGAGELLLDGNSFYNNRASVKDPSYAGNATLSGCDNAGLLDTSFESCYDSSSRGGQPPASSSGTSISSSIQMFGLASLCSILL